MRRRKYQDIVEAMLLLALIAILAYGGPLLWQMVTRGRWG